MKLAKYLYTENGWNKKLNGSLYTPQWHSVALMKAMQIKESKIALLSSIAISCIGRKLVLEQSTLQIGYYSYGEILPLSSGKCDLHNQTMTITIIGEY